jgi:hypothetical protein
MIEIPTAIVYNNQEFDCAEHIGMDNAINGGFIVDLQRKGGGGYFTSIPISPTVYRRKHKTEAGLIDLGNELIVLSDWHERYYLSTARKYLNLLIQDCWKYELYIQEQHNRREE